jgi:type I restriction enzyme, S subunit
MELKPSYKQTEVGAIPSDWEVKYLGELGMVVRGGSPRPAGDPRYFNGNYIPWLTVAALTNVPDHQLHIRETFGFLTEEGSKHSRTLESGTLIIANSGATLGVAKLLDITCCANDGIAAIVNQRHGNKEFLCHYINTQTKRLRDDIATGNGQPNLNTAIIRGIPLPFPGDQEQSAIATALGDVDALLSALDARIAKQRDLKTAVMQQLLTGKTRLPGFDGAWETERLGDHVSFIRNGAYSRAEISIEDRTKYLHHGDIHTIADVFLHPKTASMPTLADDKAARLGRLADGDVIFVDATEDLVGVGKSVEIANIGDAQVVAGLHTIAARFNKSVLADGFKAYLQFIPAFGKHLRSLAAGTKVFATNRAHIASAEIALPPINEQTAIAEVLSDMDAQLAALEQQRAKTALLKQSMMQELLTGRRRLVASKVISFPEQAAHSSERKGNVHFQRSVFSAEIVERLHAEPTFGHVKFQKLIYLAEHLCKVDIDSHYHRDAAGPYDNRALRSIDSQMEKSKWFKAQKVDKRYQYVPLEKRGDHKQYFDRYFAEVSAAFDAVIETFRSLDTERCEIVATLYSAWDDLLRQGQSASDQAIVDQVLNHWHDAKKRIEAERWHKALDWMQEKGFVPDVGGKA